jgi:ssDNA-binding replication factor A large subunit
MSEDLINKIVTLCPMVSRDQILKRLDEERQKTGGLISEESLLRMIAAEFGCEPGRDRIDIPALMIKDLVPGLNDVTVVARVLALFSTRTFTGAKEGKFAGLLAADKSDLLRVVLWNDKTDLLDSGTLSVGQIVRFFHGYTREGSGGRPELHLGEKSQVELKVEGVKERDYPNILEFSTKAGDLTLAFRNKRVSIVGTVKKIFPSSEFKRRDSSKGKVMRFVVIDQTGEVPIVVWNEKADELEPVLKVGDKMQVVNGRVKKALAEGVEVNVDGSSYVGPFTDLEILKIADLRDGMEQVSVEGKVVTKPVVRNVNTRRDEQVKLATLELEDGSGRIQVSAWQYHADTAAKLKIGDTVLVKNAYVKKGFGDSLELSTRNDTSITVV